MLTKVIGIMMGLVILAFGCDDDPSNNHNNNGQEICDNGINDDFDNLADCLDPDCFDDPYCSGEGETNCADGIDNDGDGAVDCDDSDCTLACQADECTPQWVFWESPEVCPDGTVCAFTGNGEEVACLDEAQFSAGTYYGPCGPQGECPKGSVCLDIYYGMEPVCMVSCYELEPYSDTCPDGGVCSFQNGYPWFTWPADTYNRFCAQLDECDPVFDTGCPEGLSCYLIGDEAVHVKCLPPGNSDDLCRKANDCVPGYSCFIGGDVCEKVCDWRQEPSGCDLGQVCEGTTLNHYGFCTEEWE